jgi:hypothetical protein
VLLLPFHDFCPEIADREIRSLTLLGGTGDEGLPAGVYVFVEYYCGELKRKCDCRRVLLDVRTPASPTKSLGSISYGFDADGWMPGPFIDPLRPRSKYAEAILEVAENLLFSDQAYIARLERHYEQAKAVVARKPGEELPFERIDVAAKIADKRALRKQRRAWEKQRR